VQHNLAKFTLLDDTEERNLFEFEGKDYSNKRKDGALFLFFRLSLFVLPWVAPIPVL
jgi:hypothetical protein